jgi:glycosyltransferase involved in cell wall biosynthesis
MLRNLVTQLDRARIETLVISLTTSMPIGDELQGLGIPVVSVSGRAGVLTPRQFMTLRHTATAWKPDVIHSWMYHANVVAHWLAFVWQGQRPALIASIRGALNAPDQQKRALRLVRRLDGLLSGRADASVFNSATSAQQHVAIGYNSRHISVIPNGFDTVRFSPSDGRRAETCGVLGCGSNILVGFVASTSLAAGRATPRTRLRASSRHDAAVRAFDPVPS